MIPELRMRERELKKEWIEAANWVSAEWLSVSQPQGRRNRGREATSTETKWSETKCEERWAYVLVFEWNWAEVGFRNKSNSAFCTFFFFFFLNFGLNRLFRPIQALVSLSRSHVSLRRCESAKITWNPRGTTWPDAWAAVSPARRRVPPCRTQVQHLWCHVPPCRTQVRHLWCHVRAS